MKKVVSNDITFISKMKAILVILAIVLGVSCSPQKRLQRLLKNHPELVKKDTFRFRDTVIIEGLKADTVFDMKTLLKHDTITIVKDNLQIKVAYKDRKFYVAGEIKRDTIIKERVIYQDKIQYVKEAKKSVWSTWLGGVYCIGMIAVILCLTYLIRKFL